MIEIFKTDVLNNDQAQMLIDQIHQNFTTYIANFDLEDCDHILRVRCENNDVDPTLIISLLHQNGFKAEILIADFVPTIIN